MGVASKGHVWTSHLAPATCLHTAVIAQSVRTVSAWLVRMLKWGSEGSGML